LLRKNQVQKTLDDLKTFNQFDFALKMFAQFRGSNRRRTLQGFGKGENHEG